MYVLGIDVGTTGTKMLLFAENLMVAAEDAEEYGLQLTRDGGVEQHPDDWWQACVAILRKWRRKGISVGDIACIAVSGHGCSLVATDGEGRLLRPAISSLDTRCKPQTERIRRTSREGVLARNGNDVGAFNFEPKLLWLKETEPDIYREMADFLSATGYINYRLTGERVLNVSDGGIALAFDRSSGGGWDADLIAGMGLDPGKFPRLAACSERIGTVTRGAAEATGLAEGTPVLAGGEDTSSAALALGVTRPGDAYLSLGTQGTVGVCVDGFAVQPEVLGFPHVLPGLSLLNGSMSSFGAALRWFVREWCRDLREDAAREGDNAGVERLLASCGAAEPGAKGLLFLPYLAGELHPILDERAAGVFIGLRLAHAREDMARAVLEGTAHAVRHNLHYLERAAGRIDGLRAVGGPTRSPLWCQVIADVTGRPLNVVGAVGSGGGAPLGDAMLAMNAAAGIPIREMARTCLRVEREYAPSEEAAAVHDRRHRVYTELYPRIRDLYAQLEA